MAAVRRAQPDNWLVEVQARRLGDGEYVTQYGSCLTGEPTFRDHPRPKDRDALSAITGKVTPAEARRRVRRSGTPNATDGVRYARVGDLRAQWFIVVHDPRSGNTRHVSIRYSGAWDDEAAGKFNKCFAEPVWHEEQEGGPR